MRTAATGGDLKTGGAPIRMIRSAALLGFRRLVGDFGGDVDALLATVGIESAALDSPDNRISYAAVIELLETCAQKLDCPDFGLRLSSYQDIDILGPAAMIAHYSDTVGRSLKAIATYFFVHTSGAAVYLTPIGADDTALNFEVLIPGLRAKRQINELSMGIGQSLLNLLVSPGFRSSNVQFTNRRPDDLRSLHRRFGRHLHFDAPNNSLTMPNSELAKPVPTANPEFRRIAVNYVDEHLGNAGGNQVRRITILVHQLLPTGRCSLKTVCGYLNIHPRTLQRELNNADTDFRSIVDRARRDLAMDYLRNTSATLTQVAAMLGYRDQAAFSNAFKRWYGKPPGRWRYGHHDE